MSIIENTLRIGNFTSSEIYRIMGTPTVQKTYIRKKNIERRLGRSLETETSTNTMSWGKFMEMRVHNLLGLEYKFSSTETDQHPTISYWCGSKDLIVPGKKISEIKCYQPENFAEYVDALMTKNTEFIKNEFPKEYWQMVSNAIINNVPNAEAIAYMPYRSELTEIRELASNYDGEDQWAFRFIAEKPDSWLSWLPDGGYYKNLNLFEFPVPEADIKALTDKVKEVGKQLIEWPNIESEIDPSFIEQAKEMLSKVDYSEKIANGKKLKQKAGI